ncbi:hypothetical protein K458DRAFT_435998 [Lentithecium fluviatile CBS 122367]|uniref:Uncharacterized protein n=1 Tax=Lentithecium fluviatile CBS 122367 TaxID=1168545 RepID=A0A6G1IJA8_9PLEO|nr:hypothetical protein K458DRAFT_435998 [Lentithecium fluviatile CBS 122367]
MLLAGSRSHSRSPWVEISQRTLPAGTLPSRSPSLLVLQASRRGGATSTPAAPAPVCGQERKLPLASTVSARKKSLCEKLSHAGDGLTSHPEPGGLLVLLRSFHQIPSVHSYQRFTMHAAVGPTQSLINAPSGRRSPRARPPRLGQRFARLPVRSLHLHVFMRRLDCTRSIRLGERRQQRQETRAATLTGASRSLASACIHVLPASTCQRRPLKLRQDSNTHGRFTPTQASCSSSGLSSLWAILVPKATLCIRRLRPVPHARMPLAGCGPSSASHQHRPTAPTHGCADPYRRALAISELLLEAFLIRFSRTQCNFQKIAYNVRPQRYVSQSASCAPLFLEGCPFRQTLCGGRSLGDG